VVSKSIEQKTAYKMIGAAVIGNALDWYDFSLYGYFAAIISKLFFPAELSSGSSWTPLLSSLAIFGTAFFVRPIGGIILAQQADQWGRRSILIFTIGLMTVGTAMIAFAPTYAAIGLAAPLIIVLSRLVQGLSAGGEFASATAFLVEHAPPHRRGLYGAWQLSGQGIAILLSGIAGSIAARALAPGQFEAWGWRLPFLFGLVIGPVGYYMRVKLTEPAAFSAERHRSSRGGFPLAGVLANYKSHTLIGFGLVVGGSASLYVLFVFMPTYAMRVLGLDPRAAFVAPVVAGLTVAIFCPIMGFLSDKIGRKSALIASTAGMLLAPYPGFVWLQHEPGVVQLAIVEFTFGLIFAIGGGPFSAALAEMFPTGLRATGMAVAYNLGVALFGGMAPLAVAWLYLKTGDALAPVYYVAACSAIGLVAALAFPAHQGVQASADRDSG
jgi:MHS family proline/betaine transporter-like MFS transporter